VALSSMMPGRWGYPAGRGGMTGPGMTGTVEVAG